MINIIRQCRGTLTASFLVCKSNSASIRLLSAWSQVSMAPPDSILGLTTAYNNDSSTKKVSLGVGAYRDDFGKPQVLHVVRDVEEMIAKEKLDHEYTGIDGIPLFVDMTQKFAFGYDCDMLKSNSIATLQSLSGTGALRIFAEFYALLNGRGSKLLIPNPTWGNHVSIFQRAGLTPVQYRYYNNTQSELDYNGLLEDIDKADTGSLILLHACAHNPTGCDPSKDQWKELSQHIKRKNHNVLFDMAYQGFSTGCAETDAYAVRLFVRDGHRVGLCQSYSKNFGLYGERIGALSVVTDNAEEKARILSQLKVLARSSYSNPPLYGARIVSKILSNEKLKLQWQAECKEMTVRIKAMRNQLVEQLKMVGSQRSWDHILHQSGMFCFTGLTVSEVDRLKSEFHIYCTSDGRFSIAGLNSSNISYVAESVHKMSMDKNSSASQPVYATAVVATPIVGSPPTTVTASPVQAVVDNRVGNCRDCGRQFIRSENEGSSRYFRCEECNSITNVFWASCSIQ